MRVPSLYGAIEAWRRMTTAIYCAIAVLMFAAGHALERSARRSRPGSSQPAGAGIPEQRFRAARIGRVIASALILGMIGCSPAAMHPPETNYHQRDPDKEACLYGPLGDAAIAACERILARPEPVEWPGTGDHRIRTAIVYGARGEAALALARRLATVGRAQDAASTCRTALSYLERSAALWVDDSGQGSPAENTQLVERATTCGRK